jgi:hypothetical protein
VREYGKIANTPWAVKALVEKLSREVALGSIRAM